MQTHTMTPVEIELLLHCYYSPAPYPKDSPAIVEAKIRLSSLGLIQGVTSKVGRDEYDPGSTYHATERGKAHVDMLCRLPLPEMRWYTPGFTAPD